MQLFCQHLFLMHDLNSHVTSDSLWFLFRLLIKMEGLNLGKEV